MTYKILLTLKQAA